MPCGSVASRRAGRMWTMGSAVGDGNGPAVVMNTGLLIGARAGESAVLALQRGKRPRSLRECERCLGGSKSASAVIVVCGDGACCYEAIGARRDSDDSPCPPIFYIYHIFVMSHFVLRATWRHTFNLCEYQRFQPHFTLCLPELPWNYIQILHHWISYVLCFD